MNNRITEELHLLRTRFPKVLFVEEGKWVRLPEHTLPEGWSSSPIGIVFQFPPSGYPENPFYGFYVPSGLHINGATPLNFTDPAPSQPPFADITWAFFSGNPDPWNPRTDIGSGSNVITWTQSIFDRFRQTS